MRIHFVNERKKEQRTKPKRTCLSIITTHKAGPHDRGKSCPFLPKETRTLPSVTLQLLLEYVVPSYVPAIAAY